MQGKLKKKNATGHDLYLFYLDVLRTNSASIHCAILHTTSCCALVPGPAQSWLCTLCRRTYRHFVRSEQRCTVQARLVLQEYCRQGSHQLFRRDRRQRSLLSMSHTALPNQHLQNFKPFQRCLHTPFRPCTSKVHCSSSLDAHREIHARRLFLDQPQVGVQD